MPKTLELRIDDLPVPVEVRRHPTARRMTLRISHSARSVIVTLPMRCRKDEAGQFLARHIDWVRARLIALPEARSFEDGGLVPLRGEAHTICFAPLRDNAKPAPAGRSLVRIEPAADGVAPRLHVAGDPEHCPRRLQDWLIGEAKKDLDQCVGWHACNLGLRPRRIAVRDQSSRWGSCSATGLLSFSWRLILAPPHVLDYVAAHEVAHLAEMNHGAGFWALVEKTMPAMNEARDWLQKRGHELHAYGLGQ